MNKYEYGLVVFLMGQESASGSGGVSLNIAYGDAPPEDTSKLWIKTEEPEKLVYSAEPFDIVTQLRYIDETLDMRLFSMGCASVGSKIYLFGGRDSTNNIEPSDGTINVFDTQTRELRPANTPFLPKSRSDCLCVAVGTNIYIFGGYNYLDRDPVSNQSELADGYIFDTVTETITTTFSLPSRNSRMSGAAVGSKIYLFGGSRDKNVYVFDTEATSPDQYISTISTDLYYDLERCGCAAVGSKIYLFGGSTMSDGAENDIGVFDTESKQLVKLDVVLPEETEGMGCVSIGSKIYLFGGSKGTGYGYYPSTCFSTINMFDTETNTITELFKLRASICLMGCASINSDVYLFGGIGFTSEGSGSKIERYNTIQYFSHDQYLSKGDIKIEPSLSNNLYTVSDTDTTKIQIGIEEVYVGNADNKPEPVEAYLYKDGDWTLI